MTKLEFVKETNDYLKMRKSILYIILLGLILIGLFIGLSFVNKTFQTIASITAAATIVLGILIYMSSSKIKLKISKELSSMLLTKTIEIKVIGKKEKYKIKDFENALKEIKTKFNISIENQKSKKKDEKTPK